MSDPTFGMSITRIDNEPRPAVWSDMSVVGVIGTAENADATKFPLNTPVFMYSDDTKMLAKLGSTGTLYDAIKGVNDQLGEFQVAAKVVVVRVAEGVDALTTIQNIVGTAAAGTGLFAFLDAGPVLGIIPRLLMAPGYTSQQAPDGVDAITVTAAGSGYTSDTVSVTIAGDGTGATAFAVVNDDGGIDAIIIDNPGVGYLTATVTVNDSGTGTGATATATVGTAANAVCAALTPICNKLLAHAVVDGPATDRKSVV